MLELLKTVGLVVLLGWLPWSALSLLISWGLGVDFGVVYMVTGVLFVMALFWIVKWGGLMNLEQLVQKALKEQGFDGLFNADGRCACKADDLFPCGHPCESCEPGYLAPCDGTCDTGNCDWHIQGEKPVYGDIMPETAGRALAELMGYEYPIKEPEKQGPRTSACGTCQYRGIDGGPSAVMVCNAPGALDMGYGIIEWEGNERVSYCCPLEKEDKQMDQEGTERPALRHCDMERGDHAWAVLQEKLVVVMRVKDGYFVCGPWECRVYEDELILLERIERPKSAADMPLYYLDLLNVDAVLDHIAEQQ